MTVPGARFCHNCAAPLPSVPAGSTTERRVVTVLFGDLTDFTTWSEDLDPERVSAVTDRVLAAFAGAVTTFGGQVDKLTGDGIMAVFGAPVAHEDDPDRAVRAALAMQRAVRRVLDAEEGGGVPLKLRVGLNTGEVAAGVQASLEYTVIGDVVTTAARLADIAAVGSVYAGSATYLATRQRAAWRKLAPLRLKGKREPVDGYELLGLRDAPGTRTGLGDEAPFIGREPEMGRFDGRLAEVTDRHQPRVLAMTAEAGVGKSRFAAEAERRAAERGARVLSVQCEAYGERRRLAPLADLVRQAAGLSDDDGGTYRGERREAVRQRLDRVAGRQPGDVPRLSVDLLLALLGHGELPTRADRATGARTEATDAVPAAVADLLSLLATESPLVVIVDDVHDATGETLRALGTVISGLAGSVLVLLLGRPELTRTAGLLSRIPDAELAPLPPLRGENASRLLRSYLNGGRLDEPAESRLLATAQGNPFYLSELVTLLMERGRLVPEDERGDEPANWSLAPTSLGGQLLSRDLAAVLAARIDALNPAARSVLRDAAVVGDTVPTGALAALQPALAEADLDKALGELVARTMLRRAGRDEYVFATPLMREAAYANIGKADLADRHARLARWASAKVHPESTYGPIDDDRNRDDAFVADHAAQAVLLADEIGLRDDADARSVAPLGAAALSRMAARALDDDDPGRTVDLANRARAVAQGSGGGGLPVSDRLVYGQALLRLGRTDEARAELEDIATTAISDQVRIDALVLVGEAYRALGSREQAREAWEAALVAADGADLAQQRADTLCKLGMSDYLSGRFTEAQQRFEAAYQVSAEARDKRNQAWALQHLSWVSTSRGDFAGTDAALGRAAKLFAELDDDAGRAWVRGTTAFARLLAGRLTEADGLARAFLPVGERLGDIWAVGTLRSVAAFASAELGRLDEAERAAERAHREFQLMDDQWGRGMARIAAAMAATGAGRTGTAIERLTEAEQFGEKVGHPLLIGMARTIRGFCHLDDGDPEAAERDARAALDLVEPYGVLDAARVGPIVLLAEACRLRGDTDGALRLLSPLDDVVGAPLLLSRRQIGAIHALTLLAAGRPADAAARARAAVDAPGEDLRGTALANVALARALLAAGEPDEARKAACQAHEVAYRTERSADRPAVDALLAELSCLPADLAELSGSDD